MKAYPSDSYQNAEGSPYRDLTKLKQKMKSGPRESKSKSNFEALSPSKHKNSNHKYPTLGEENRYSFASNFRKAHKTIDNDRVKIPTVERRMQAAGNNAMRYSSAKDFGLDDDLVQRSHSLQPAKDSMGFKKSFQTPQKSRNNSYFKFLFLSNFD